MNAILPHLDVLIVQIITFVLGMGAIWALYLKPLGKHLRERKEGIVKDLAGADAARGEAERLRAELGEERARLAEEARQGREEAKRDSARLREELMAKARAEQEALLASTRSQLKQEKNEALRELREQVASLVVLAAAKLIEKKLDSAADKALAEKLVKTVRVSKN